MSAPKTLVAYSGGKDSTTTVIKLYELRNELEVSLNEIELVFCEVMFDRQRSISGESPAHIRFLYETAFPIFQAWGFRVRVLRNADWDYVSLFHKTIERSSYPDRIGQVRGFPIATSGRCWVKRDLKTRVLERFYEDVAKDAVTYVGICADEPIRLRSLYRQPNKRSILAELGITQAESRMICEDYGLLSPIYELSNRGGCWFCPWVKPAEWAAVPKELREELIAMEEQTENISGAAWNPLRGRLRDFH